MNDDATFHDRHADNVAGQHFGDQLNRNYQSQMPQQTSPATSNDEHANHTNQAPESAEWSISDEEICLRDPDDDDDDADNDGEDDDTGDEDGEDLEENDSNEYKMQQRCRTAFSAPQIQALEQGWLFFNFFA